MQRQSEAHDLLVQQELDGSSGIRRRLFRDKYLIPNQWHCLEQHLRLNTRNADGTFNSDGLMEAWFDDELVYRQENLLLHTYTGRCPIEINGIHGQIYHGGRHDAGVPDSLARNGICAGTQTHRNATARALGRES